MTGLRKWRKISKSLVLCFFAWDVAATIVSLALLIFITIRGGSPSPDALISVFGTLGIYGIVIWAVRDAQRRRHQYPRRHLAPAEEEA